MTDTLIAIDKTYRKWSEILELVTDGRMEDARERLDTDKCPLCELVIDKCLQCPVVKEFGLPCTSMYDQPCGRTRVFRMAFGGVDIGRNRYYCDLPVPSKVQTIKAIVKMLFLLDWLWERVRWRAEYIKENA